MVRDSVPFRNSNENERRVPVSPTNARASESSRHASGNAIGGDDGGSRANRGRFLFTKINGRSICVWPGCDPIDCCWEIAGFVGVIPKGITLRQLWLMETGMLTRQRRLLVNHGWVIGCLFGDKVTQGEVESFIQYGYASSGEPEPRRPGVDEKVAQSLKAGHISFD